MTVVQQLLSFLNTLLSWWVIVEPWEQAVRVRFGKHVRIFNAGLFWKIPFFDIIYKQNVRRRVSGLPAQTLTTGDGKSITVVGSIGYRVVDVLKLHTTLHDAETSILQEVLGAIAGFVIKSSISNCSPAAITEHVMGSLSLEKYGLGDVDFFLSGFVSNVPTYRLLQDSLAPYNMNGSLTTQLPQSTGAPR
jgi:hypothetical protein